MSGFDWNDNGHRDAGDSYMDYEIMNDNSDYNSNSSYRPRKKKKPMTPEELENSGKIIRQFIITWGTILSVIILFCNILGLFSGLSYVSFPGIIVSIVALVLIRKNVKKHKSQKKG